MKNIHLIPTDKPSRLFLNKVNNKLLLDGDTYSNLEKILPSSNYQHLYITSDEEIEDCWVLNTHTNEVYFLKYYYGIQPITKKIILTTDQSLDGVQAIDDDFLEWFVKNPSCEKVEVIEEEKKAFDNQHRGIPFALDEDDYVKQIYKIIIPKEPKHETLKAAMNILQNSTYGTMGKGCDEESKQEKDINYWKNNCEEDYITTPISVLRYISELEKLSTQEEISDNQSTTDLIDAAIWSLSLDDKMKVWRLIDKLVEEEKETLYTKEEVIDFLQEMNDWPTTFEGRIDIREWFKQFKKK
jgi:hypothetical protein